MSINNRKYIQSTGSLLARLNEESNSNPNNKMYNQQMQQKQQQQQPTPYTSQPIANYNRAQPTQYQPQNNGAYSNIPQYTTAQVPHQQTMFVPNGFNPNSQNPIYGNLPQQLPNPVAVASQFISQINNQGIFFIFLYNYLNVLGKFEEGQS